MQVRLEFQASAGHASVVQLEHEVALLGEILGAEIDGQAPGVEHGLGVGSAVDGDQQRMRAVVVGSVESAVERCAVGGGERAQFGSVQAQRFGGDFRLIERPALRAVGGDQRNGWGSVSARN